MPNTKVQNLRAREVLDSRGNPTVEVDVWLTDGSFGRASVPSGASTGSREALELRDNDRARYLGKGVKTAAKNVRERIAPLLIGQDASNLRALDSLVRELDGTPAKSSLGANAMLGVSMALCRAMAAANKLDLFTYLRNVYYYEYVGMKDDLSIRGTLLPTPLMNIINGGKHADNKLSIQEFMIVPTCGNSFSEALRAGVEVFHHLKKVLQGRGHSTNVGDEGGFAPNLETNEEAFEVIIEAISHAGYRPGQDVYIAVDAAASEFWESDSRYKMSGAPKPEMSTDELIKYYFELAERFPIVSLEDGLQESDWAGWKKLTQSQGRQTMLVGDDLFVTNAAILDEGIKQNVANAILIKLNQIGTVSETLETIALARKHHYNTVISHRSGETEDSFLADLAVATDAGLVKTGSASRGERMAKYNQLLRIEETLGSKAKFSGLQSFGKKF